MNRRGLLKLAGAGLLSAPTWRGAFAQPVDQRQALIECIDHHRRYRACFATKFRTGYCDFSGFDGKPTTNRGLDRMLKIARARLMMLSDPLLTGALLYHVRDDGRMDVFLIGHGGLEAWERVDGDVADLLGGLRIQLDVDTRAATRSAMPIGKKATARAERQAETQAAVPIEIVSQRLLPGSIGAAIAGIGYRRLLVLASGAVSQAPFPALMLPGGRAMVERASVILLADPEALFLDESFPGGLDMAAETFTFSFNHAMGGQKLMVGNPAFGKVDGWALPPLPGAEAEIESVAPQFRASDVLMGKAATRKAIMARLGEMVDRGGIAYFATHGVSDAVNPMDGSFLAVAGDVIRGQQIRKLRMVYRHPLVVMSACQTGLGKTFGGGGYGLARAWYAAGAGQVVGSLWNVSDEGTNHLMTGFARNTAARGMTVEEGLRMAMLETRDTFSADPAIWASFVAFGNPGA